MFRLKKEQPEPEPTIAERAEAARLRVEEADRRVGEAGRAVYDFQCENGLTLDNFGRITGCSKLGGATSADLWQRMRALLEQRSLAFQDFNAALQVWAGLKGA